MGQSYLAPVSTEQVPVFNVTFEPGCRNNWHVHHAGRPAGIMDSDGSVCKADCGISNSAPRTGGGQMLICVGGRGYYQAWGEAPVEMTPGTVVNIPPEVKHWHGAAPDAWFSHLAIEVAGEETSNEWLEPVSEEEYKKLR